MGDPEHFEARRQLVAFVAAHLDEIHERAVNAQPASADVPDRVWVYWGQGMGEAPRWSVVLDATCLVRENVIAMVPELLSSGFFAPRYRRARISSWFMASRPGNRVIEALRRARIIYRRHHDRAIDHFVLHHLFEALSHLHPDVMACCETMPLMSSRRLSRFRSRMLSPYDADRFRTLLDDVPVHKLTHKISPVVDTSGTMLDHLLRTGAPD